MEASFNLSLALENDIVGQKRTGKHKQFVFIRDDYAIKGPYQESKLHNVLVRSQIFSAWKTPCVVLAHDHITSPDGAFIRFPNIMSGHVLQTEPHSESFSTLKYKILKDAPVIDIGHAIPNDSSIYPLMADTILALCHCNILGVGDMNVRNTMINPTTHQFYIIDFDDNLTCDRDDEVFYFNKPPAKKFMWHNNVSVHYNNVADRLLPLLTDDVIILNNMIPRVERAINLLRLHAKTDIIPLLTLNVMTNNIGHMIWKGLRGGATKTFSGIDFDIAKSALQKYIRRNMVDKAIKIAIEMYRLGEINGNPGVTNMYNRLALIANEDIGPSNLPLVLEVTRLVQNGDRDIYRLVTMVKLLAESSKTRIMSHAWRTYAVPEGREAAIKMGILVDTDFSDDDIKYFTENKLSDIFAPTDPENIRIYILIFLRRLLSHDFNAFTWAHFYIEASKDVILTKRKKFIKGNARCMTGKPDILLWKALARVIPPETHDILVEAYYNHTESRPFLQLAIILALYNVPYNTFDIETHVMKWKDTDEILLMMEGKYEPLEIDDFVIDKHTQKGRSMGKDVKDFVDEGAIVIPQDMNYYNEKYAEVYRLR